MIDCINDNVTAYHKFSGTNQSPYQQSFNGGPADCHRGQRRETPLSHSRRLRRSRHIHHGVFGRILTRFCRLSACPDPAELEARCSVRCIELSFSVWTTNLNGNQIGILRACPGHGHAQISLHCLREWLPHVELDCADPLPSFPGCTDTTAVRSA
jgi:hypothetical protein